MSTQSVLTISLFCLVLGITGCGGGGGDGGAGASRSKVVTALPLPTSPDQTVGGIQLTLNIPMGVTVRTNSDGSVASAALELVGASGGAYIQKTYTPASASANGSLTFNVFEPGGFTSSEYLMVHLDITPGANPKATDFSIDNLVISDLNGRTISGLNYDYSVEII